MDEKIRINKFLSDAGVCSRREADRLILEGRITVNGEEAVSGQKVSGKDEICIDQIPVEKNEKKVLLLFNKPRGIVCSTKKQRQETTVTEYLDYPLRIYPVGRLDKDTEGLVILTNDGELSHELLSPTRHVEKDYLCYTLLPMAEDMMKRLEEGVDIGEKKLTKPAKVSKIDGEPENHVMLTITEGKCHQVKRMMLAVGNEITYLKRLRMGPIVLPADLSVGCYRELIPEEVDMLRACTK